MNKLFQFALAGWLLLTSVATAVQLSDLSPTMTRSDADENLTKDYAYRVLSDLSVRRIWNLDDNRKLSIDFEGKSGKLICIVVDYRVPVSTKEAGRDAADIGKYEEAAWRKFSEEKAAKYFMGRSRAMKFDEGYMFQELTGGNKCQRLTFYAKRPRENRRHLSEGSTTGVASAMGNTLGGSAVKTLLKDEERRLFTPNKTDKTEEIEPRPKKTKPAEEPEEIIEDTEFTDEPVDTDEPEEIVVATTKSGKVVKGPIDVKPVKEVKQKGDRSSDFQNFLAKLGLDKLEPIHWILGVVGLVVLISVIGAVGRSRERRKLEERAERLRNSSAQTRASLRKSVSNDSTPHQ